MCLQVCQFEAGAANRGTGYVRYLRVNGYMNSLRLRAAAIHIGEETVYSNAAVEFQLPLSKPEHLALTVLISQFLTPLNFMVVSAPRAVTAIEDSSPDA